MELKAGKYYLKTTGDQGSARLASLKLGNALVLVPPGAEVKSGGEVDASLLDRSFEMQE